MEWMFVPLSPLFSPCSDMSRGQDACASGGHEQEGIRWYYFFFIVVANVWRVTTAADIVGVGQ